MANKICLVFLFLVSIVSHASTIDAKFRLTKITCASGEPANFKWDSSNDEITISLSADGKYASYLRYNNCEVWTEGTYEILPNGFFVGHEVSYKQTCQPFPTTTGDDIVLVQSQIIGDDFYGISEKYKKAGGVCPVGDISTTLFKRF